MISSVMTLVQCQSWKEPAVIHLLQADLLIGDSLHHPGWYNVEKSYSEVRSRLQVHEQVPIARASTKAQTGIWLIHKWSVWDSELKSNLRWPQFDADHSKSKHRWEDGYIPPVRNLRYLLNVVTESRRNWIPCGYLDINRAWISSCSSMDLQDCRQICLRK